MGLGRIVLLASISLACGETREAESGAAASGAGQAGAGGAAQGLSSGGGGTAGSADASNAGRAANISAGGAATPTHAAGQGGEGEAGAAVAPAAEEVDEIMNAYRGYAALTPDPVAVSSYLFGLCRLPTLPETEFLESIHGDERYLRDWANPQAQEGLETRGAPAFPPGAVIVKEKFAGPNAAEADLVALGIMIKREPGFAPAHGDWEYAYYEPALGVVQTTEQSSYCAACHARASTTDYVFVDGLQP